ncbi:GntR family transcriptional regulator [Microbacterium luticocti]|uniref:GntR family transcriptional regulator n=1 Tax=Microbacterium luticocti TaxID=451764 RepID=UPI00048DCD99|nr:GntR family transcriptional regulator [Microbacterium luticocti]
MTVDGQVRSVAAANASAVDLVTAEIRRAVLTGALAPGANFSIRDLAAQLGVSHIPIREALRRLESQGLIILRQARSASVAPLTSADLQAIYRLRYVVELPLAGASAGRRTPAQIARLDELLEGSRHPDPDIAWQAHYDFHAALVHPAANDWDERVLETLWMAAERYTHLVFDPTQITEAERARRYETHRVLREAALVEDPDGMAQALRQHLRANEERILSHIAALEHR